MTEFDETKNDVIKIANEIIQIGQDIRVLAEADFYIDFKFRANQLHHISKSLLSMKSFYRKEVNKNGIS